jgi:hypothetical protein
LKNSFTKTLKNPPCSSFIEYRFELQMLPIDAKPLTADLEANEDVVSSLNKSLLFVLFLFLYILFLK